MNSLDFKVCVTCLTYNHSRYINDALKGFCMQKTSFNYVCCILDDASTDGEQDVLRQYMDDNFELECRSIVRNEETDDYILTFARHKQNNNCYFAVIFLKYNHYKKKDKIPYISEWQNNAKYLTLCEGDDFWNDPLKLQKQYDYMEAHNSCSLCFHANYRLYGDGSSIPHHPKILKDIYGSKEVILLGGGMMATNSMFYLSNHYYNLKYKQRPEFWKKAPVGDVPLALYLSTVGDIGYINEYMSTYRIESTGSWTNKTRLSLKALDLGRALSRMLGRFDEYTEYKYHKYVIIGKLLYYLRSYRDVMLMIKYKFLSFLKK